MDSPGAGPSRTRSREDEDRAAFLKHRKDYLDLQESVQSSTELLSSLASYLSTFQTDLSAVSGHISELQQKSADIDGQLKGRRNIIPSLNALVADITLPPSLVLTLRDTTPSQNPDQWLAAIPALEQRILALSLRGRVRAAHEIEKVVDGLRTKALTQLPPFLLSLIRPLRSASKGLSTNLAVLQTSLLLKYQPFYTFLVRQSPRLARQVERGYVSAARAYYETGLRRYCRALASVKARTPERSEPIGYVSTEAAQAPASVMAEGIQQAYERLQFAAIDAEGQAGNVVLAYMVDDKDFTVPVESLFRSLGLVLVDNASAEFTFIVRFFTGPHAKTKAANVASPSDSQFDITSDTGRANTSARPTDDLQDAERIWHDVFDPALEYCANCFQSMLNPPPPAMPLLTIIRFNDRLIEVCDSRGTLPLKTFLMAQKLAMWPIYRKEMDQHVDSLKRLADDAEGKGLAGFVGRGVKDGAVRQVASRYASLFTCVTALSEDAEEAMMFSSMSRMRAELVRLFQNQAQKIKNPADRHSFLSSLYEIILHELVSGPGHTSHPRLQSELSYFRTREEESRRRISA